MNLIMNQAKIKRSPYWKHSIVCRMRGRSLRLAWMRFKKREHKKLAEKDASQTSINFKN